LPWDDLDGEGRPVDEALPGVLARGRKLRRRRRVATRAVGSLAIVTCLVGVTAAVASTGAPSDHRLVRAAGEPTTVAAPQDTTTSSTSPTVGTTGPVSTTTTRPPAIATTTTLSCHNSSDPRCGPFRWSTDPGPNAPLTVDIKYSPAEPHPGDVVTFTVTATDPDASHFPEMCENFGEGTKGGCISGVALDSDPYCGPMFGPWDPPARKLGNESLGNPPGAGVTHAYASPGTYAVTFSFGSAATFCGYAGPYASRGSGTVSVMVVPADTTTSTTTTR
jgi:hypothetical protein